MSDPNKPQVQGAAKEAESIDTFLNTPGGTTPPIDEFEDMTVDLSETPDAPAFQAIPPGEYNAMISEATPKISQKGNKMIEWQFSITDGPHQNRKLFYHTVLEGTALGMLKQLLVRVAPDIPLNSFSPSKHSQEMVGRICRLKVGVQPYQGEKRNRIREVLPPPAEDQFFTGQG